LLVRYLAHHTGLRRQRQFESLQNRYRGAAV